MYKIGELSQLCRLPVKTLRYWADIGLLVPDEVDRFTGYRYYDASRLADCSRIVALKELGFTLEEIRQHTSGDVPALIAAKKAALTRERERINVQLRRLEAMLAGLTGGESNMFEVMIRSEGCIRAAYVRRIFTDRAEAMSLMAEMRRRLLFEKGIFTGGAGASTVRLLPSLAITRDHADKFLNALKELTL